MTDPLTGLPNRRSLNAFLRQIRPSLLSGSGRVVVYIIDIDFFKDYNDSYGHLAGDECLIAISRAFSKLADSTGLWVYRFGGEEFIAVTIDRKADADALGEKLVKLIYETNIPHKKYAPGRVTVSVGCCDSAEFPMRSDVDLLNYADIALYQAKKQGRNRYVHYNEVKRPEILP